MVINDRRRVTLLLFVVQWGCSGDTAPTMVTIVSSCSVLTATFT